MAFIEPTAADFTTRFASFTGINTDVIDRALSEAAAYVDHTWINEADFQLGKMLYAAHTLTLDGHGNSVEAELSQAGDFKLYKSGSLTLQRAEAGTTGFARTSFGQRFADLRARSAPSVAVVC